MGQICQLLHVTADDAEFQLMEKAATRSRAFCLFRAQDGSVAMQLLTSTRIDFNLVVIHWNLPGMSAADVLMALKGDPSLRCLPVVVIAATQSEDIRAAYLLGASCVLVKPADPALSLEHLAGLQSFWGTVARLPHSNRYY